MSLAEDAEIVSSLLAGITQELTADWPIDSVSKKKADPTFFMDPVVFEVDGCLFRVPRKYFEDHSLYFKKMYLNPRSEGEIRGSSTLNPIVLEDVSIMEFRDFLTFISPASAESDELPTPGAILNSTLRLSTMWRFNRMRSRAIDAFLQLDSPPPIFLVHTGMTLIIPLFFKKGILGLVKNPSALTQMEERFLEKWHVLDGVQKLKKGRGYRTVSMNIVCAEFKELIKSMEEEEKRSFGVDASESNKADTVKNGKAKGGNADPLDGGGDSVNIGDLLTKLYLSGQAYNSGRH